MVISQFGVRNLQENQKQRERRIFANYLQLDPLITDNMTNQPDFRCFRIICDDDSFQKLLSERDFQNEITKYWTLAKQPADTTKVVFSKHFKQFKLIEEKNEDKERVVWQSNTKTEDEKMKYTLSLKNNTFVKMQMDYVDKVLVKAILISKDGTETKIKLAKCKPNKNQYSVTFNFLRQPSLLLPLVIKGQVVAFFCKYDSENETSDVQYEIKENENDIIVPNHHSMILQTVKQLNLRVDMTYFLKGIVLIN